LDLDLFKSVFQEVKMSKLRYGVALVVATMVYAGIAAAHAVLVSSSPANGSMLTQAPKEIRLSFNEAIEARFSSVTLTKSDGRKVQTGRASSEGQKHSDLVVSVPALEPGKYQVRWQATSADSHRIQGNYAFEVKP
jgi:methionine-rich copper-binding protein CopC